MREWYRMYKTAEGKGENKYGLDGSAARSKCLPWQWCLARLLLCLLGAHLAAPGSLALPLGSAHPLGAQPLPGVLELLTYDPSTLLTLTTGRAVDAAHALRVAEHTHTFWANMMAKAAKGTVGGGCAFDKHGACWTKPSVQKDEL